MQDRESVPSVSEPKPKIKPNLVEWCAGPTITVTDVQEPDEKEDVSI